MKIPTEPKIYHIVHIDRLPSILAAGGLVSDATMQGQLDAGTEIGIQRIKERRRHNQLNSRPGLYVGQCVPFYFCPRSVMLYVIDRRDNPDLPYQGGQEPIIHLESDLRETIEWAEANGLRWAFTTSNAGAYGFRDYSTLDSLGEINWQAVRARSWAENRSAKQAEFLVESRFPWELVNRVGVLNDARQAEVQGLIQYQNHQPRVEAIKGWYY